MKNALMGLFVDQMWLKSLWVWEYLNRNLQNWKEKKTEKILHPRIECSKKGGVIQRLYKRYNLCTIVITEGEEEEQKKCL